jgi:DNA-binding NarL/FixJ family response regulator
MARDLSPDVIIMDIDLGKGPNGVEAGISIKEVCPAVGIVLLSAHKDKEYLSTIPADQSGGWSYLLKQSLADVGTLIRALQGAAAGLVVLDPELVMGLRPRPNTSVESLRGRYREVLELMAQGYSNAAIAEKLVLGEKSIENYINGIYQHLQISREDAIHPRVKAVLLYLKDSRQAPDSPPREFRSTPHQLALASALP